jgi:ABC-2 type transport system ATP-binding protein
MLKLGESFLCRIRFEQASSMPCAQGGSSAISIIEVKSLTKIFDGKVKAVDDVSFTVEEGEILGFLGPNGAGKTTTLNMLSTLLRPTSGTATVNGYDIIKEHDAVRRSIGFVFQDPTLDLELTGYENLDFHGRLYGLNRSLRQQRIEEMLDVVQLSERARDFVKTYSGGMKRRLEIARGLLHHPQVLFLDEPTLGLDPQTRRSIWDHIQSLNREKNVTIILTTHYTEEADHLCERIQIIDRGRIVALDTPENLKARLKGDIVSLAFKNPVAIGKVRPLLEAKEWVSRVDVVIRDRNHVSASSMLQMMRGMSHGVGMSGMMGEISASGSSSDVKKPRHRRGMASSTQPGEKEEHDAPTGSERLNLLVDDGGHRIPEIVQIVTEVGDFLESVELHKPTLDDVFLSVTGRNIRDEKGSFMDVVRRHRVVQQARGRGAHG